MNQRVGPELLTQRAAIDTENASGLALIAVRVFENGLEQRPLDFADYKIVQVAGTIAIEIPEVLLECIFSVLVQGFARFRGFED